MVKSMINFRFSTILAMGLIAATGIVSEAVAQQEREQVKLDPVRVSLFKNGYGYVTLRGKTGKSAAMEIHNLPVPTFGTFWMSAASPAKISCFVSSLKKYESNSLTATMADFARANPDSKVRVVTKNGSFEGTVIDTRPPESDPFPSQIIGEEVHQVGNYPRNGTGNSYLAVRTPSGIVVVADSEVIQLEFAGSNLLLPKRTTWKPVVELNLEKPTPDCVLTASCMTWGISWVPSYRLEMGAADKGVLSVKATVMNELMDLENVHLDLITGTPDLQTSGIPSPLAMQTNMADFLAKLGIGNNNEERPRPLAYRKRISREAVSYAMSAGADTNSLKAPSKVMKVEDLYHYPVKQFSSKRGATVAFPLFSVEVPYQTVYTWDIPVTATYSSSAHLGDNDSLVNIWHWN